MIIKTIILTLLTFSSYFAAGQFSSSDIIFSSSGLSEKYTDKFKKGIYVFVETLNDLEVISSIKPIDLEVSYEDGKGIVMVTVNFDLNEIYSKGNYAIHNNNWSWRRKGISVYLQDQLFNALSIYKLEVAIEDFSIDNDICEFDSYVKLKKSDGNWVNFYAYNYFDFDGFYKSHIYTNVHIMINGEIYETETSNPTILSDYKYFSVDKQFGLDGEKTGAFYFCKFFNIKIENDEN
jgi:hypothetical protein